MMYGTHRCRGGQVLTQTAEYALRAVLHLAAQPGDRPVRVPDLADAIDVPRNYLAKTLNQLTRAGVLRSARGPTGGFRLACPAHLLTIDRVVAPFSGPDMHRCLLHDRPCGAVPCAAHARWAPVARDVRAFFGATTVADLTGRAEGASGSSPHPHHSADGGETL
jgi:Rrf2 family protein